MDNADLSAHLGMIVESYRDFASKRNIDLQFVANGRMKADFVPEYINKVVNNLLSNAFKFTPRYGRVSVKVAREGTNAVISVIDTGVGIAPDAVPHLFESFYKVGADASQQGTGIGLALVR